MVKFLRKLVKRFKKWCKSRKPVTREDVVLDVTKRLYRLYPGLKTAAAKCVACKKKSKNGTMLFSRCAFCSSKDWYSLMLLVDKIADARITGRALFIVTDNARIINNSEVLRSAFPEITDICESAERRVGFDYVQGI